MQLPDTPLAERLRPQTLTDYVGQAHLTGEEGIFQRFLKSKQVPSFILWGPPGVGKTSLALLLAQQLDRPFYKLSAVNSGVKEVREVLGKASKEGGLFNQARPLLFIDEIHRFSKSQQDSLLAAVEKGDVTLIGATTENPSFEVISPLLSRCQVFVLKEHTQDDLQTLLNTACEKDPYLKSKNISIHEYDALLAYSGGDCRKLLNALEWVVMANHQDGLRISNEHVQEVLQENRVRYDKQGEQHYDIISAFIKSIRGSDPNGTIYWLARMLEGGEDPKFIARRLIISASEDIGNANPTALIMANNCFQAVHVLGMPEARIVLSQCAVYLASSAKSNASYLAIDKALALVRKTGNLPIPLHLRNAPTKLMKNLDYGKDYKYPHDYTNNFVAQNYLPDELKKEEFLHFGNNARENELKQKLKNLWGNTYEF